MSHKTWLILLVILIGLEAILTGIVPITKSEMYGELAKGSALIYITTIYMFINLLLLEGLQSIKIFIILQAALSARINRTLLVCNNYIYKDISAVPQRIQEDIKLSYLNRYTANTEYAISGLILVYLLYVNWAYTILIFASLGYAGISIILAYLFNPKLTEAEKIIQTTEAAFRINLTDRISPLGLYEAHSANIKAGKIRLGFGLFSKVQSVILTVAPYIVLTPLLIDKQISFQEVMNHATTFALIVVNAAILINIFPVLIQGHASESRIKEVEM